MLKKVLWAGLLGAVAMIVFSFLVNGVFGLNRRLNMKPLPAEREVYEVLKTTIRSKAKLRFHSHVFDGATWVDAADLNF